MTEPVSGNFQTCMSAEIRFSPNLNQGLTNRKRKTRKHVDLRARLNLWAFQEVAIGDAIRLSRGTRRRWNCTESDESYDSCSDSRPQSVFRTLILA